MKIAKHVLVVGLVLAFSAIVFPIVSPRSAQAVFSTFVQVTNDGAHAVPVVEAPTAVIFNGPLSFGTPPTLDVSAYRKIRVSFATRFSGGGFVRIRNVDGSVPIFIAEVGGTTTSGSTVIEVPGRMISLEGGNRDGTTLDSVVVDGR
jgi:hypothetical protein